MNINTLRETARAIRDWQLAQPGTNDGRLSDSALCKRFGSLGSTKTWSRILDLEDDLDDLRIEEWAHNYARVLELIRTAELEPTANDADYEELTGPTEARAAVQAAMKERGNNRLVIIEGRSGSGKTTIARIIAARWPNMVALAEADETWKSNPNNMLGGLLMALPTIERKADKAEAASLPSGAAERKDEVIRRLASRRRVVVIDEAHHLGPSTLNMLKTLINQTDSVFVILAIPTLLRRLMCSAYEEARQLTSNRLCARVVLPDPAPDEVSRFLDRRGVQWDSAKDANQSCARLAELARDGQWALVNLVARELVRIKGKVTVATFVEKVQTVKGTR